MKKLAILFLVLLMNVPIANAVVNRDPVSRHWENAFFGGAGTFPMVLPDIEIPNKVYLASDVAGNMQTVDAGDNWTYMNYGTTSIINASIAQSEYNPDIMYSLGLKLLKSTNRGKSWTAIADYKGTRSTVYKTIAIGRTNPNIVFVGLDNGKIMKTVNGGASFTEYATPFGANIRITFIYIDPTDSYIIVGGQDANGMKRYHLTDDSSSTITLTGTNATYNWDYDKYKVGAVEHLCVTAGLKIACTTDNGDNWTYTAAAYGSSSYICSRLAVKYLASTAVKYLTHVRQISTQYGTTYQELSDDSGATWTDVANNVTMNATDNPTDTWGSFGNIGNVQSMAFDPHSETKAWITTDWRVFRSDDGGTNWTEKVKGAQNQVVTDVTVSPNGILFACGMDIGCHKSTDNGDHWTAVIPKTSNGDPQGFAIAGFWWRIITLGTEAEWNAGTGVVIATSSYWADFIPRTARSTDNGVTWTIITSGLPTTLLNSSSGSTDPNRACWGNGYPRALACHPNGSVCYLGIDGYSATENGGIFYSTDKGLTWHRTTQPPSWRIYNAITVDPTDATGNTVMFSEWFQSSPTLPHTYKSTDRGATWTTVATNIGDFDMSYNASGNAYKVGLNNNPRIDFSGNGDTWAMMHNMNETAQVADGLYVDPNDPKRVFVGVNDGTNTGPTVSTGTGGGTSSATTIIGSSIYVTNNAQANAAATWTDLTGDFPSPSGVQAITVDTHVGRKGYLFAATDGAGIFRLNLDDTSPTTTTGITFGQ